MGSSRVFEVAIPTPQLDWQDMLLGLAVAIGAFFVGKLVGYASRKLMMARGRSHSFAEVFGTIIRWATTALGWSVALIVAFPSVNFASVLSGVGLASLVIGIAAQSVLGDFFSGIMLVVREPFREGDQVEINQIRGSIQLITLRETVVRTFRGTQVVIPNKLVHDSVVRVQTGYERRLISTTIGVAYGTDFDLARRVLLDAVLELPQTLNDPPPTVRVGAINASSIDLNVNAWVGSTELEELDALDKLIPVVIVTLERHGIEMPPVLRVSAVDVERPADASGSAA